VTSANKSKAALPTGLGPLVSVLVKAQPGIRKTTICGWPQMAQSV
jgi:hypothetical protein